MPRPPIRSTDSGAAPTAAWLSNYASHRGEHMDRGGRKGSVGRATALWDGRRLDDWTEVLADDLVTEFDPAAIWLFGSVARGDGDSDIDIDILVVLDVFDPRESIDLKIRAFRATTTSAPFDVTFTDPTRNDQRSRIAGTIERATVLDGRCLYRRD